jgi:hypothetical protein
VNPLQVFANHIRPPHDANHPAIAIDHRQSQQIILDKQFERSVEVVG